MSSLFLGLYGIYMILVAVRGNASEALNLLQEDAPNYLPWLIAILVLAVMNDFETTQPIVKPFIALLVIAFVVKNFSSVQSQVQTIYSMAVK